MVRAYESLGQRQIVNERSLLPTAPSNSPLFSSKISKSSTTSDASEVGRLTSSKSTLEPLYEATS
jgi:hypothetical protein